MAVALFARLLSVGADPPICLAPTACEEVVIGALFNEGVSGTDLAATHLAIEDVNGDANVLPHTHLVLLESSLVPLHAAEVATADTASQRVAVADAVRVLADAGAVAAVGAPYSSDVFALEGELAAASIPLMSCSATHANLSALPHFARVVPPDTLQAMALADLAQDRDWARLGIVRCADVYCRGLTALLKHELSARGLGHRLHVELEMDHSDGGSDVNATIVSLTREFGSDPCIYDSHQQSAVFMVLKKDEAAALLAELVGRADLNLPVRFVGADGVRHSEDAVALNVFAVRPSSEEPSGKLGDRIAQTVNLTVGSSISSYHAYDSVWALAHALHAAHAAGGSLALSNITAIMQAVLGVNFAGVTGDVAFDASGDRHGGYHVSYIDESTGEEQSKGIWDQADGTFIGLQHNQPMPCNQIVVIGHLAVGGSDFADDVSATVLAIADINADSELLAGIQLRLLDSSITQLHNLPVKEGLQRQHAAESAATALVTGGAIAALGSPFSSHVKLLSQPLLHDAAIPLVGYRSTASALSDDQMYPHFARVCPPDSLQVKALVEIVLNQGWTNLGIIHCEDAYCTGLADNFKQQMSSHGIVVDSQQEKELLSNSKAREVGNAREVVDWMESTFDGSCTSEEVVTVMLLLHRSETEALFEVLHQRDEEGSSNLPVRFLGSDSVGSANTAGASSGLVCMLPYVNHAATLGSPRRTFFDVVLRCFAS